MTADQIRAEIAQSERALAAQDQWTPMAVGLEQRIAELQAILDRDEGSAA